MGRIRKYPRFQSLIRVLLALVSLCVAFYILTFGMSFSWFSENKKVDANGMSVGVSDARIASLPFVAYKFDYLANVGLEVTGEDVTLPTYDSVFVEKNVKNSLYYNVTIFGEAITAGEPFTITLDLKDLSAITGNSDYNHMEDQGGTQVIADYISNIINIRCGVVADLQDLTDKTPTDIFNTAYDYFYDTANTLETHTFFEGTNGAKTESVSFAVSDYLSMIAEGNNYLNVFIEIGYDSALINSMIESRGISININNMDTSIEIESDLNAFAFGVSQ